MLSYTELKPGKYIVLDGQPYVVLEYNFLRMQQRKPVVQTKIKNLATGKIIEKTFQANDEIKEAEIEKKPIKYLYSHHSESWFCEETDPSARFKINEDIIGNSADLLKPNLTVEAVIFNDSIIGIKLPVKIEFKVIEAPPSTKGNTAQGGTKQVKLETGATLNVPLFINQGDVVRVNIETREYVERVKRGM